MAEMNGRLPERWGRAPVKHGEWRAEGDGTAKPPSIKPNPVLRDYWTFLEKQTRGLGWRSLPEMPAASEIFRPKVGSARGTSGGNDTDIESTNGGVTEPEMLELPANRIDGSWRDKEEYLGSHYALLREDVISPLRDAVTEVQANPSMTESNSICIYENVCITGFTFSRQGPAARVCFSTMRAKKRIRWEQSTRMRTGSIVALSPSHDLFRRQCRVAVVAARPMEGLQQNPPTVDLLFAATDEIEIDPLEKWVMVESRNGFFEANRHTLLSLQKMMTERFPLSKHLVDVEKHVQHPLYVQASPSFNLNILCSPETESAELDRINVLEEFPSALKTSLDGSQLDALKRMLSKRLAVVQGPPGTGKTHVSVLAVKALLEKVGDQDPPLIITSQTNHALDQILRLIAEFEPNFIRLGSRSMDQDVVKPRTLREIRQLRKEQGTMPKGNSTLRSSGHRRLNQIEKELKAILSPLKAEDPPLPAFVFFQLGLLSQAQYNSLEGDADEWVQELEQNTEFGSIASWLGTQLHVGSGTLEADSIEFEFEELDLEFEQLKELEAETPGVLNDDEGLDRLSGTWFPVKEPFTAPSSAHYPERIIKQALQAEDLCQIEPELRGAVYTYLRKRAKDIIRANFRKKTYEYLSVARQVRTGAWEEDAALLKESKVIGMTTTGLSKYRALIASLKPKVVMVEEASEALEGHVTAACFESLEHLILVGDHKQLRGHCSTHELEGAPFNLDVSLFERMIRNGVESTCLTKQRRMIPEIRALLSPIYERLDDHESVHNREPVPGMGGVNSLFYSHTFPESLDSLSSKCNKGEADMIVGLFNHLVYNGLRTKDITVLTFYNGQRKLLLKELKALPNVQGSFVNVKTVDSYQGEENAVIILSLVRSSTNRGIGFVSAENRICVAISRAQRGLYMFGNSMTMANGSTLWKRILRNYRDNIKNAFPVTCTKHGKTIWIKGSAEWGLINGGCQKPCGSPMSCGHTCPLKCHPFEHSELRCDQSCRRNLDCGHACLLKCHVGVCRCKCSPSPVGASHIPQKPIGPPKRLPPRSENPPFAKTVEKANRWHEFAQNEAAGILKDVPQLQGGGDSLGSALHSEESGGSSGRTTPPSGEDLVHKVVTVKSSAMRDVDGSWRYKHKEVLSLGQAQSPMKHETAQPVVVEAPSTLGPLAESPPLQKLEAPTDSYFEKSLLD
ncbi:MAG: hypothetical protein M4579_004191 [Chaenotheca gracillima]|nr:MAG: hypothetical protein M4579_004191 [Chaenotheca gracillima]